MTRLLEVKNLTASFHISVGIVQAVRRVSFHLDMGESLGVVGESGSGKSVTMLSVMGLLPKNAEVTADSIRFNGIDLLGLSGSEFRKIRGGEIGMIFQDPKTSLNPLYTVEKPADGAALHTPEDVEGRGPEKPRWSFSGAWTFPTRSIGSASTPTSSPAACVTGDDRDGGRLPAQARHRGRADHGSGRDHPGAGAGASGATEKRTRTLPSS